MSDLMKVKKHFICRESLKNHVTMILALLHSIHGDKIHWNYKINFLINL